MKYILFLLLAWASVSCSKSGTTDTPGPNPPPPPPMETDKHQDTLGNWVRVKDNLNEVNGHQIVFVSKDTGYVANAVFHPSAGFKATYDGGKTWLPGNSNYYVPGFTACSRLYMISGKRCILHGEYIPLRIQSQYQPFLVDMNFNSATPFVGSNYYGSNAYAFIQDIQYLDTNHYLLRSSGKLDIFRGKKWDIYSFSENDSAISVHFVSASKGFVGTRKGKLFITNDGGNTWTQAFSDDSRLALMKIYFADLNNGWIVTNTNILLKTSNGGSTWQKITLPIQSGYSEVYRLYRTLVMVTATRGFLCIGKNIYETTDGGVTWARSARVGSAAVNDICYDGSKTLWAITGEGPLRFIL